MTFMCCTLSRIFITPKVFLQWMKFKKSIMFKKIKDDVTTVALDELLVDE